jgi:(3S)-malyl-CoA thioesterase
LFDLEDGVGTDRKEEARDNLIQFFQKKKDRDDDMTYGILRINGVDTRWFQDDASVAMNMVANKSTNINGVVLPKVESRDDVDFISQHFSSLWMDSGAAATSSSYLQMPQAITPSGSIISDKSSSAVPVISPVPIWAMMETPRAILSAVDIAGHPSIQGLILGTNDLSKELRLRPESNETREGLSASLQLTILAARAHDKPVIDGVYNNFRDEEGFRRECIQGKAWGVDGKTLIHPSQIAVANDILAPSSEEIEHARRVVACWEESGDTGVAVLDGAMIEQLHVDSAKRILEQANMIGRHVTN